MKRVPALILLLTTVMCQISMAQSLEDKRRVEEEKRKDLLASEVYSVEIQEVSPPEAGSGQNVYFTRLLSEDVAVLSDAYKTLVILMGLDDQFSDTDSQLTFLREKGIVPKSLGINSDYNDPLNKGVTAYMFAKAMDIKGGVTLRLFGFSQRYALKELVYQGIMVPGNVQDVVSGQELILTLMRAADYMIDQQRRKRP
jgi:hypothetical protein